MNRVQLPPQDAAALLAIFALTVGVSMVQGVGWALIVISTLVLIYIVLPDRGTP